MISKLVLIGCIIASSSNALSLEVGELTLHSNLGEPLKATLTIKHNEELGENDFIVNSAPASVYKKMGINYNNQFNRLKFRLDKSGQLVIRSQKPIKEPFMSFVLQFRWPKGEVNKAFNLLIDPPNQ